MKIRRDFEQGSAEWSIARAGRLTASELDNVVTTDFAMRTGQTLQTYVSKKIAEKWLGGPLAEFNTWDMDQGTVLEQEALPWYNGMNNTQLERVGLIESDDGRVACSPDGWDDKGQYGVEIKCPAVHTHVSYLRKNAVPAEYLAQVHGSMFVTGADRWVFFSYCRGFPKLCIMVERDPDTMDLIDSAVDRFYEIMNTGYDYLVKLNGGPPKRKTFQPKPQPTPLVTDDTPH